MSCKRDITVEGYENHCKTQRHRERAKGKKRSRPWLAANPYKTYDDYKIGTFWCDICEKNVRLNHKEAYKRTQSHTNKLFNSSVIPAEKSWKVYKSYAVRINHPSNVDAQFAYAKPYITDLLKNSHLVHDTIKLQLQLESNFDKAQDKKYKSSGYFKTKSTEVTRSDDLDKISVELFQILMSDLINSRSRAAGGCLRTLVICTLMSIDSIH